jgi:hypothetical protein
MIFGWFKRKRKPNASGDSGRPGAVAELAPVTPAVADLAPTPEPVLPTEPFTPPAEVSFPADKIAARAYEIWVRKGRPNGADLENWTQAEAELRAEVAANPPPGPHVRKPR